MGKYEEALERAKEWEREHPNGYVIRDMMEFIFPGYNDSEDEMIRKELIQYLKDYPYLPNGQHTKADFFVYLEKQKEQPKEELVYRMNGLMQKYIDEGRDEAEREHRMKCYNLFWDALEDADFFKQKPGEWSEEDETCLEYALWCVTKTRLFAAKDVCDLDACRCAERWLKALRPQPQRRDTYYDIIHDILATLKDMDFTQITPEHRVSLLNDIRVKCKNADECAEILDEPHWKPSEEQMEVFFKATPVNLMPDELAVYHSLCNDLKKL